MPIIIPDTNASERPMSVFTFAIDISNGPEPTVCYFSAHKSRREALIDLRSIKYDILNKCKADNKNASDFVFDAVSLMQDESLRFLKRTRIIPMDEKAGGWAQVELKDYELFEIESQRINKWVDTEIHH